MRFGQKITMLRDYDGGRFRAGETYTVTVPGEPENGRVTPGVADALCRPAADGEGAYAEQVNATDEDEE
jgi:hypothetical protein